MFEDISLISYLKQNPGLYIDPFSPIKRPLLNTANCTPRSILELREIGRGATRPVDVLHDRPLRLRESVVILTLPVVDKAIDLLLLLVAVDPLQ